MQFLRSVFVQGCLLLFIIPRIGGSGDICRAAMDSPGIAATVCDTPYCICNNPYGRVYCSCIPRNSTIPKATHLTIRSSGSCKVNGEAHDLIIENCANVTIPGKELDGLSLLKTIQISNVAEINVSENSFFWNTSNSGIRVEISNATIVNLPSNTFRGYIERIIFRKVYLGHINAYAFSSITSTDIVQFIDCNFANIEAQSFKKFTTKQFLIERSRFNTVPSRFIFEVHALTRFHLDSSFIDIARTLAFHITHPTEATISGNTINLIQGEAFKIESRGRVTLQDNAFESIEPGAFKGISMAKEVITAGKGELLFDNNTLGTLSQEALMFNTNAFHVRLTKVRVDDVCSCDGLLQWKDTLYPHKKGEAAEHQLSEIWCHVESKKEVDFEYISGDSFYQDHCATLLSSIFFLVIVVVTTVLGLCVVIIICVCFLRKRRQKWDTVPTSEEPGVDLKKPAQAKGLVIPDGRVYRETEFHVVVEKAEPLDEVVQYKVQRDRSKTTFVRDNPS